MLMRRYPTSQILKLLQGREREREIIAPILQNRAELSHRLNPTGTTFTPVAGEMTRHLRCNLQNAVKDYDARFEAVAPFLLLNSSLRTLRNGNQ